MTDTTHFGYREVDEYEKADLVGNVFRSVAKNYDLMNDLMSFGVHRLWKQFAVSQSGLHKGGKALDVAGGSGDLSIKFSTQVGSTGQVIITDINEAMLTVGRERLIDKGIINNVQYAITDAEQLSFADDYFNCVSISFGLRNVTRIEKALSSMYRVIKPGGRLLVLEFSKPQSRLMRTAYDTYSFNVIPKIGKVVAKDEQSYRYLVESIRKHPDQETLKCMMQDAGFEDIKYHNLTGGVVALHIGFKY